MSVVVSAQEVFDKACELVRKPNVNMQELTKAFCDFALLLDSSYEHEDGSIKGLWFQLGCTIHKMGYKQLAINFFEKAIDVDPGFTEACNNLGYIYKKLNNHEKAKKYFRDVIDYIESEEGKTLIPDATKAEFLTNYGSMFVGRGTPNEALKIFDQARKYKDDFPLNDYNRGLALLEIGEYQEGFEGYNKGERVDKIQSRHYGHQHIPEWDGTPGKNVVVIGEQGLGDELMFGTVIPDIAKECNVVLDTHPRLADMFRRSFPKIDTYGTRKEKNLDWGRRYQIDSKILMGSLPAKYRKSEDDFPRASYLVVDQNYDKQYKEKLESLGERPKIGISWRGGTKATNTTSRYIPLEQWLPILKQDCDFISLQYDPGISDDIRHFCMKNEVHIFHWPEMVEDYEQTAACVKHLDLIISVPQSVVHLAGVIGQPLVWQLCPFISLWQCGVHGKDMPWYSNTKNYWQENDGEWQPVMDKVTEDLCKLLQTNTEN